MSLDIAINGAGGRMGRMLLELVDQARDLRLAACFEHERHSDLGRDVGELIGTGKQGITLTATPESLAADAVVDFSLPEGTRRLIESLQASPLPLICGTTGLDEEIEKDLLQLATKVPVIWAPNFSTGVNLLLGLAAKAAEVLSPEVEIEISETHHRYKRDSPSGTAARLVEVLAAAAGSKLNKDVIHGRSGIAAERPKRQIGVHALRGGEVVGEHTVHFFAEGERLELTHRAESRAAFAAGALNAARWCIGRKPGMYAMTDVLNLK